MKIPVKNCSSCGACANICAHGAITMQLDKEGFYRPVVDSSKCVKCGLCEKACPWESEVLNPNGSTQAPKTVAAYAQDEEIRLQSSSGGIFTVLAEKILDEGGVVVGVAQLSPTRFGHIIVDNKNDLAKLRGSKYVQADVGTIYKDVRALLKDGRKVLFSGTPCQVAGLYAVLGKTASANLFTVDVVCHGVPSVKVFEKYISELELLHKSRLYSVVFRDKETGWKTYSLLYRFENGNTIQEHHEKSNYMRLFLSRICQNASCTDCSYRKLPRIADITLGDFWGLSKYYPEMDDNKGTSVVLLNTDHGKKFFDAIEERVILCDSRIEYAAESNPCIVKSSLPHPKREEFLKKMTEEPLGSLVAEYFPPRTFIKVLISSIIDLLRCIKNKVKNIF